MKDLPTPRAGLSVAALLVALAVPLAVGWWVEREAYGNAKATESVVAPLRAALTVKAPARPHPAQPDPKDEPLSGPAALH